MNKKYIQTSIKEILRVIRWFISSASFFIFVISLFPPIKEWSFYLVSLFFLVTGFMLFPLLDKLIDKLSKRLNIKSYVFRSIVVGSLLLLIFIIIIIFSTPPTTLKRDISSSSNSNVNSQNKTNNVTALPSSENTKSISEIQIENNYLFDLDGEKYFKKGDEYYSVVLYDFSGKPYCIDPKFNRSAININIEGYSRDNQGSITLALDKKSFSKGQIYRSRTSPNQVPLIFIDCKINQAYFNHEIVTLRRILKSTYAEAEILDIVGNNAKVRYKARLFNLQNQNFIILSGEITFNFRKETKL